MHPEIEQDHPGKCPKCGGMDLVLKDGITQNAVTHTGLEKSTSWKSYMPLLVIISLIFITSLTIFLKDFQINSLISNFMIGFFLVFSGFKLMDLKGFAEGYSTYDLLAKKWYGYGYIYPFIELFFGLGMIVLADVNWLLWTELLVMTFSGLGVALKLARREKFQCACLGTFLKVPLTKVTLIEDFGMAGLALLMLLIK